MIAQEDLELREWLDRAFQFGGGFVQALAETAWRADAENYELLRPALLEFKKKYPKYSESNWDHER